MNELRQDDLFATYDGALSAEFCRNVVDRFENDPRKTRGMVGEGTFRPDFKGTTEMDFNEISQGWEDVIQTVDQSLMYYLRRYMQKWSEAFTTVEIHHEGFRMARYDPGQQFDWHSDNMGDSFTRVITALWYLNTVQEGGETEYKWLDASIKPIEGRLMLCPVGWPYFHRSAPPVTGPKYIIITQLHQQRLKMNSE